MAYTPGEYEVSLFEDDQQHATTSIDISPELEIVEVGIGANHPDRMPEELPFAENQVLVVIENTGTGPDAIENLEVTGAVPDPTTKENQAESGIFDVEEGFGDAERVVVGADATVEIFSSTYPFVNPSDQCLGDQITINLLTRISEVPPQNFEINYESTGEGGCYAKIPQEVE